MRVDYTNRDTRPTGNGFPRHYRDFYTLPVRTQAVLACFFLLISISAAITLLYKPSLESVALNREISHLETNTQLLIPQFTSQIEHTAKVLQSIASQDIFKSPETTRKTLSRILDTHPSILSITLVPEHKELQDAYITVNQKHGRAVPPKNFPKSFSESPETSLDKSQAGALLLTLPLDPSNTKPGYALVSIDYPLLLENIATQLKPQEDLHIITVNGDYYSIPARQNTVVQERNLFHKESKSSPATRIFKSILLSKDNSDSIQDKIGNKKHIFVFNKTPLIGGKEPIIAFIASNTISNMLYDAHIITLYTLFAALCIILITTVIAFSVIQHYRKPLKQMIKAIEAHHINMKNLQLPTHREDEIGELATSFEFLTKKLELVTNSEKQMHSRLQAILDNTVDGLITINEFGIVIHYNKACIKIFGYQPEEVIGNNIKMLMPDPYQSEHDQYIKNYHKTKTKKIIGIGREVEGKRKNGTTFPMELSVGEVQVESQRFYSGIVRDITERKAAEDEIIRSNEELERFAYVASHDLQEPLRMVKNFTSLLEKKYSDKLDDTAREYIDIARSSAMRMQDLVSDLLEYARIGNNTFSLEKVDTEKCFQMILQNLADSITSTGAKITHDELPILLSNQLYFILVVQNILSNAIKYQKEGNVPIIHIATQEEKEHWQFTITDNGIGMKPEYCDKIFQPFKRLHGKHEYSGTGMGLSICRKIIEGLGGKIWATSDLEKGSTFNFILPKQSKTKQSKQGINHA